MTTGETRFVLTYPQMEVGLAPRDLRYRFNWNAPIRVSPHDPQVVYHCSQVVHRTRNEGQSWEVISPDLSRNDKTKQDYSGEPITKENTGVEVYSNILSFEESPHRRGELWAGTDDGLVHVSRDDGRTWTAVTPKGLPEWATIQMIELSPHSADRVYVVAHKYKLRDPRPFVFRSDDAGRSWTLLTSGANGVAPDLPTRVVREDPSYIAREPLGIVMVVAPWNYPYLTSINTIVPALLAGNAVILKHAAQTLLVGERFAEAFRRAGLPKGLFHNLVLSHEQTEKLIGSGRIDHINFTGSVAGGRAIVRAASGTFASLGLELGGKDPAYVRADAKLDPAIENLADGTFYNSGQCCCGIERIYVDASVFDAFLEPFADLTRKYVVGNALEQATTMGPMARASFAELGNQVYALRLLGLVAAEREPPDVGGAKQYFGDALDLAERLTMRSLLARCHLGLGRLYRRFDEAGAAEPHLTKASQLFEDMGMTFWLGRLALDRVAPLLK